MQNKVIKRTAHRVASAVALVTVATFWLSTVASELSGSIDAVVRVKTLIPWGLLVLVPAMATAGATGFSLTGSRATRGLSGSKARRMRIIALNGILVLVPAALYLAWKAAHGAFDLSFWVVQSAELIAGAANITLMSLNIRDGLKMTGRVGSTPRAVHEVRRRSHAPPDDDTPRCAG